MSRSITDLDRGELQRFITAYEKADKTEGGKYSLSELLVEQLRRSPAVRSPRDVLQFIVETASKTARDSVTYGQVWAFLYPDTEWKGNHSVQVVGATLNAVIAYCVRHRLPLVTTLVVQAGSGKLSERAIVTTYEAARRYGFDVGPVPKAFVAEQAARSRQLTADMLPHE